MDRISTSLSHQQGISSILQQQTKVNNTQQQISLGKRIISPSDDPAGSVQLLDLSQSLSRLEQFQANNDYVVNRLSISEATLQSVTDNLQRVRELALQGFNEGNTLTDKQSLSQEMYQRLDEIIALANTKDANGDYLYAGFNTQTKPFTGTSSSGSFDYKGDQSQRFVEIGDGRTIADGNAGSEVFFNLQDASGNPEDIFSTLYALATDLAAGVAATEETTLTLAAQPSHGDEITINGAVYQFDDGSGGITGVAVTIGGDADTTTANLAAVLGANDTTVNTVQDGSQLTITANIAGNDQLSFSIPNTVTAYSATEVSIPLYDHLDQIDTGLGRVLDVRSQIGARLNVLDSQNETNLDFELSLKSTKSQIEDIDIAEAISRFNFQIVSLQAAQQAYVKVQNLSLFNLL